jgi:hypothetical protein
MEDAMKRLPARTIALVIAIAVLAATAAPGPVSTADDDQAVLQANQAFDQAATMGDAASLGKVLDAEFTWTTSDGRTLTRAQVLRALPKLLISRGAVNEHTYGDVAIVQEIKEKQHALRVWVKRPAGWRELVYQEVRLLGSVPTSAPSSGKDCENPCRAVPFKPKNEAERAVITAYQNVERGVTAHDSAAWGAHIAEGFFAVTSNSDRPLDKTTRMAGLDHQTTAGIAPFPLVSARMFQFGDTMIMVSRQQPGEGKPLHVTRVWIARDGNWLEIYSYQTTIQAAAPAR